MSRHKSIFGIVDVFLLFFIFLNIADFFEFITPELDYAKKILSWVLLGLLLYQVSLTKVFFGSRDEDMDTLLIVAYFSLVVKNLISYAQVAITADSASPLLEPFYNLLIDNHVLYEQSAFVFGIVALVLIAVWAALKVPFHKRSIVGVLHEYGQPSSDPSRLLHRFAVILLVFFGFFVWVFNLLTEWLAIAIDAILLLVLLLVYSVVFIRHRGDMHRYVREVGTRSDRFFAYFIDHFRYRETFLLGVCGLLVLHLLTDIGNFLVPYLTGLRDMLYFGLLDVSHRSVWEVLFTDWGVVGGLERFSLLFVFLGNIVAFLVLFISPAIIWHELYRRKRPSLPRWLLVVFFVSLPAAIARPLFGIVALRQDNLVGVDIITRSMVAQGSLFLVVVSMFLVGSLLWFFFVHRGFLGFLQRLWVVVSSLFFGWYIWLYFSDVASYYIDLILGLVRLGQWFFAFVFFVFFSLLIVLYVGGFFLWLYELVHRPATSKK